MTNLRPSGRTGIPVYPEVRRRARLERSRRVCLAALAALLSLALPARAGVPDWLRAVAQEPLPPYPADTQAVVLLDEQITTVKDSGEIKFIARRAIKILRPQGRDYGTVRVYFDNDTRITYLKAWSLPAGQREFEVKEKDAVEVSPFAGVLFSDNRVKVLEIPAAEPGNIIGYEYEQRARPFVLSDNWWFARPIPTHRARYILELPRGWEFDTYWLHHADVEPQPAGENRWLWELKDLEGVEDEPEMPDWRAVAGRMELSFHPTREELRGKSHNSWDDVARWAEDLARPQRQPSPEMQQKVRELTADAATPFDKIKALAAFAQRDVRYVAIEIGIGGWKPHAAPQVFSTRYGDCKDKATLLSTMLREIGVDSYYVLAQTNRGVIAPAAPSVFNFNHAIVALRVPDGTDTTNLYAVSDHPRLGPLLYFDPTDELTPLGYLPAYLQANHGLLVTDVGGDLVPLPLLPPATNRLLRQAKLTLSPTGDLTGTVTEIRWGQPARRMRSWLLAAPASERRKVLESILSNFLGGFVLQDPTVENLEEYDKNLVVHYRFTANKYAKVVGNLLLLRPRVLGQKSSGLLEEKKERKYPVQFDAASLDTDLIEIALPAGYRVDELPPPVDLSTDFADYRSHAALEGSTLRYQREYSIKQVEVPVARLTELKLFFRQVAADERNQAVLQQSALPPAP